MGISNLQNKPQKSVIEGDWMLQVTCTGPSVDPFL